MSEDFDHNTFHKAIFEFRKKTYYWKDVLEFAEFLGLLKAHTDRVRAGIDIEFYALESGYDADPQEIQNAVNEWRYDFNLITAQETEDWLKLHDISLDDFHSAISRNLLRLNLYHQRNEIHVKDDISPEIIYKSLWPEIILGNRFNELIIPFVLRVVSSDLDRHIFTNLSAKVEEVRSGFCMRNGIEANCLQKHLANAEFLHCKFENYLTLEAKFQLFCSHKITIDRCNRQLASLRANLTRITSETVSFSSLNHAREAYYCIVEDQELIADVARKAKKCCIQSDMLLDDLPENWKQDFLSAGIGQTLPPMALEQSEDYSIHQIVNKIEPEISDNRVFERVQQHCLKEMLGPVIDENVKWLKWHVDVCHG